MIRKKLLGRPPRRGQAAAPSGAAGLLWRAASAVDASSLLLLLAVAPFLLFPSPATTPAMLVLPLTWGAAWMVRGAPLPRTPLNAALLVLCAMVGVSLFATYSLALSLSKIAGVLLGVAAYFAVVRWLDRPRRLWLAAHLLVLAGAVLAGLAFLGTDWSPKLPGFGQLLDYLPRVIRGLAGAEDGFHPNAVGGTLVYFVPLQVLLLLAPASAGPAGHAPAWLPRRVYRLVQVLLLCLTAGVLLLTQSRGAWLGCGLAVAALLAWHGPRSRWLLGLLLALAAGVAVAVGPQALWQVASPPAGPDLAVRASQRLELWARAVAAIQDFALTGMGMNTFRYLMPSLYPAVRIPPGYDVAHAHNLLLQAALDLGLPGMFAYLSLWLGAGRMLLRASRRAADPWLRGLAVGLGAGLGAHFVFGLTDAISLGAKVGLVFWVMLALSVGLYRLIQAEARPRPDGEA